MEFVDPDWESPLDVEPFFARVPSSETMKGMFVAPVVKAAHVAGVELPGARARYLSFHDYPLVEHMRNLVDAARGIFPQQSLRMGLRRLGRGALGVMLETTFGRVTWAAATDPVRALEAITKIYSVVHPGCSLTVVDGTARRVRLKAERVYGFLECHHVGVLESALRGHGVNGRVQLRLASPIDGELLCTW